MFADFCRRWRLLRLVSIIGMLYRGGKKRPKARGMRMTIVGRDDRVVEIQLLYDMCILFYYTGSMLVLSIVMLQFVKYITINALVMPDNTNHNP